MSTLPSPSITTTRQGEAKVPAPLTSTRFTPGSSSSAVSMSSALSGGTPSAAPCSPSHNEVKSFIAPTTCTLLA